MTAQIDNQQQDDDHNHHRHQHHQLQRYGKAFPDSRGSGKSAHCSVSAYVTY